MAEDQKQQSSPPKRTTLWRLTPYQICSTFENSLKRTPELRSEDVKYLKAVSADDYAPLLFGLLQREIACRQAHQNPVTRQELESRFPNDGPMIDALMQDALPLDAIAQHLRDYECLERIRGGPIGGVYRVRHVTNNELRLVRRISAFFLNPEGLSSTRAVTDVAHLFHTNITAPIELVEHGGSVFVVMEYSAGLSLANLIARYHPVPVPVVCEIVRQAASGVGNMHDYFKAHEDIRPANILVEFRSHEDIRPANIVVETDGNESGVVKIGGVPGGLVNERRGRYALWPNSTLLNAPVYFAPEILTGKGGPDTRSDVFALGMVLHHALAGDAPTDELVTMVDSAKPPLTLAEIRPDCPPDLAAIILRMTAAEPEDRFESAADVESLLEPFSDSKQLSEWLDGIEEAPATPRVTRFTPPPTRIDQRVAHTPAPTHISPAPSELQTTGNAVVPDVDAQDVPRVQSSGRSTGTRRIWKWVAAGALSLAVLSFAALVLRQRIAEPSDPTSARNAVAILTELPGPNGDWWFDEMPWFTPDIRAALADRISSESSGMDRDHLVRIAGQLQAYPDVDTMEDLKGTVRELIETLPDDESMVVRQILEVNPEAHTVGELKTEYGDIVSELDPEQLASADKWHLRATLLAASSNHQGAALAYEKALSLYDETSGDSLSGLKALCAADYGRLLASYERNYKKANVYFRHCARYRSDDRTSGHEYVRNG